MLKRLMPYLVVILLVLIDIAVVPVFTASAYVIPGTLVFVMTIGMLLGRTHGMLAGLLGGLLVDILVGYPLGYMTFSYIACGYLTGLIGYDTDELRGKDGYSRSRAFARRLLAAFLMLMVFETVTMVYQYFNSALFAGAYIGRALLRALIGAALTSLIYYPLARVFTDDDKKRVRIGPKREVKNL
jgi:rod shape-determining protein MreD